LLPRDRVHASQILAEEENTLDELGKIVQIKEKWKNVTHKA
jgi:hypothetical protein